MRLGIIPPRVKTLGRLGVRALRRSLGLVAVVGGRAWGVFGVVISQKLKIFKFENRAPEVSHALRAASPRCRAGGGGSSGPGRTPGTGPAKDFEIPLEVDPTKPTNPGFVGFVGSVTPPMQKILGLLAALTDPTPRHPSQARGRRPAASSTTAQVALSTRQHSSQRC